MSNFIITIDGPAASGKSTAARLLAKKINASFLDTGAMYRAVTYIAMQDNIDLTDEKALVGVMDNHEFSFKPENDCMTVNIDGNDVTQLIRDPQVTANAKYIASATLVRENLVQMQRQFASEHDVIVTEGRDQGTVAFPNADAKFFLTANAEERAKRRLAELKGASDNLEQIQQAIEKRDKSDMERNVGPLKPADDAILIETTSLDKEQVVEKLFDFIRLKGFPE